MSARPEPVRPSTAGTPGRSAGGVSAATSKLQRHDLGRSVEALRGRVAELTDWRRQVREHRSQLIVVPQLRALRLVEFWRYAAGADATKRSPDKDAGSATRGARNLCA